MLYIQNSRIILLEKSNSNIKDTFFTLSSGLKPMVDFKKYPDNYFLFKGEDFYFQFNYKTGEFKYSGNKVGAVLKKAANISSIETHHFIKDMVEKYFLLKFTTLWFSGKRTRHEVENDVRLEIKSFKALAKSNEPSLIITTKKDIVQEIRFNDMPERARIAGERVRMNRQQRLRFGLI